MEMEVDDMEDVLGELRPQHSQSELPITHHVLFVVYVQFVKVVELVCPRYKVLVVSVASCDTV